MRLRHNFKSRIAAAMAAVMVFSMAAPALPVYAATATITFDTGDGPDVTRGNNGYTSNVIAAEAGTPLRDIPGFAGVPLVHSDGSPANAGDSDARPAFPDLGAVTYDGYTFGGWYNASDPLKYVEAALPLRTYDNVTYAPKWIPSGVAQNFDYTVMHYRMLDNSNTELPATDSGTFYQANYIAFNPNGNPWVSPTQKAMGDTVTAVPLALTAVPGYKVGSVIVKNNKKRKFGEASGAGTGAEQVSVGSGNVVSGVMPNDDLTIRYLYVVDTDKSFTLRTEYVDQTGTTIKAPTTDTKNAEQAVSATPPTIAGFVYDSVQVVSGDTDNANASVYGTNTLATHNKFQFNSNGVLSGVMPNQNAKIKYTYRRNPAYQIRVQVQYFDNHGNKLDGQDGRPTLQDIDEPRAVGATGAQTVPVPFLPGYLYTPAPNVNLGNNNGAVSPSGMVRGTDENLHFNLQAGTDGRGALITITYVENLNDATTWARVSYTSTANGDINGNTAPRSIRVGSYTWEELVGVASGGGLAISADPIPNYKLEGWYVTINGGAEQKIYDADTNSSAIPTADHKLAIPAGTTTPTAVSVYPKFVEDPNKWYTINFAHSANGSLSGNTTVRVGEKTRDTATGQWNPTTWADVPKPTPVPANPATYTAQPWTSSSGSQPTNTTVINGSETYTTVFTRIGLTDDGVLAMPNASGEVANNGTGTVKVNSANSLRNYAITDMNGNVIATLPGSALQSGAFTGLPVNAQYQVYELTTAQNPTAGTLITNVVAAGRSQPTVVNVPAVGANATVGTDAANAGQKTITVSPTAPNTEYSLIDASGNVVPASGWVTPSTPSAAIVFDNLDPNTTYTVVARPVGGSQTPQDQLPQGTVIPVTGTPSAATQEYTLKLENGGKVVEIKRMINGTEQIIPIGADDTNVTFREGDKIKFDADVPAGTTFKRWNVLLGNLSGLTTTGQRITMPAGSVTVSASYNGQSILPAQPKADLDYSPKDGRFALDPADNVRLLTELIANPDDTAALANPSVDTITYIAKFNRGTVASNYANELKTQVGDNEIKLPWSLQVGLARDVDGVNKVVPASNSNATMRVIARLDDSIKNNTDYELWKRTIDPSGNVNYVTVPMNPADLSAAGFDGNFSFEAKNGDYLVLSYKKAHTVTVIDAMRGTPYTFRIAHGSDLASQADYTNMRSALALNYTDPTTGVEYEFDQFRKANSQTAPTFADSDAVTRDMTLYAMYIPADDTAWQNARNNLIGEINRGNAVMTDPRIIPHLTPTELSDLTNAVTQANALANRLPRPTTTELINEHADLKALIDAILARIAGITPAPTPTPGGGGGGSHSGGGGGGGSHSGGGGRGRGGSSRGVTGSTTPSGTGNRVYQNGAEGNWVNFDPAGHGWSFELGMGKKISNGWADVAYTFGSETKIYSYHFNENGVMDSGWWKNNQGVWYHLSTDHDGWFGSMDKGWYRDGADGKWYYLNIMTGSMLTGWQEINGTWYYLNPVAPAPTWDWDATQNRWVYANRGGRPYGSMYINEVTPDGYHVDASGAWIRETP